MTKRKVERVAKKTKAAEVVEPRKYPFDPRHSERYTPTVAERDTIIWRVRFRHCRFTTADYLEWKRGLVKAGHDLADLQPLTFSEALELTEHVWRRAEIEKEEARTPKEPPLVRQMRELREREGGNAIPAKKTTKEMLGDEREVPNIEIALDRRLLIIGQQEIQISCPNVWKFLKELYEARRYLTVDPKVKESKNAYDSLRRLVQKKAPDQYEKVWPSLICSSQGKRKLDKRVQTTGGVQRAIRRTKLAAN